MIDPNIVSFLQNCIYASKTQDERFFNLAIYDNYLNGNIDCNWNADQTDITVRITDSGIAAVMAVNAQDFYLASITPAEA